MTIKHLLTIKELILLNILWLLITAYSTGWLQFALFGDITYRLGQSTGYQEDSKEMSQLMATRWQIVHIIDSL